MEILIVLTELRKDQIAIKFDEACSRWIKSSDKDDVQDITLSVSLLIFILRTKTQNFLILSNHV